ncbi:MAG: AEC family transporter [Clostridia bacterium]|nr:AEC family transporter [Clostridia bacterium]
MQIFESVLGQTLYLLILILIGFLLAKLKILPESAAGILGKLENTVLVPALVLATFMNDFTVTKLATSGGAFLFSAVLLIPVVPMAIFLSRLLTKDGFTRNIYTYGLAFANFGYMGNSVVKAVFPGYFSEYLIFTMPLYIIIYLWGVPTLLMNDEKSSFKQNLKSLLNPMFIAMLIGMAIGLTSSLLPSMTLPTVVQTPLNAVNNCITVLGNCMSPVAMLLTGITVANIDLRKTFSNLSIYAVTAIRLLAIPLVFLGVFAILPLPEYLEVCAMCAVSMPLGLNTVVIPSAYGKDTSVAAGMALISHLLSCITIPLIFLLF